MKLAYVYDAVHPWETGGVQKRVWELSTRLADDHDVHWYGLKYWDGPRVIDREGVTLHGVGPAGDLYVDGRRSIPKALSFTARLAPSLLREEFDVVDCQEFPYFPCFVSRLGASLHGATLFVTWHEVWGDYWKEYLGWKGGVGKAVERLVAAVPHRHLAVSERTRRDLDSLGVSDATLLPNGISTRAVDEAAPPSRDPTVLYAGRLIPEKNPVLLVEAVDELVATDPDLECLIVGEGPEADAVDRAIADRGLDGTIERRPFLERHAAVLGLMQAADVFALPSQREGFGITALEAHAAGTPVVTLDHHRNAARELVTEGRTGAVCDPTPSALAAGIERARVDVDSADCTDAAAAYEWDRIAARAEEIYLEAI